MKRIVIFSTLTILAGGLALTAIALQPTVTNMEPHNKIVKITSTETVPIATGVAVKDTTITTTTYVDDGELAQPSLPTEPKTFDELLGTLTDDRCRLLAKRLIGPSPERFTPDNIESSFAIINGYCNSQTSYAILHPTSFSW